MVLFAIFVIQFSVACACLGASTEDELKILENVRYSHYYISSISSDFSCLFTFFSCRLTIKLQKPSKILQTFLWIVVAFMKMALCLHLMLVDVKRTQIWSVPILENWMLLAIVTIVEIKLKIKSIVLSMPLEVLDCSSLSLR